MASLVGDPPPLLEKQEMSQYSLFIDDERDPPRNDGRNWIIARDWDEVFACIIMHGMPTYISFDHDLGEDTYTGHDIAKFLVGFDMDGEPGFTLPEEFGYYVHSQNPVGRDNINGIFQSYLQFKANNT